MSIYFLQELETGFIKIGTSKNPDRRMGQIANSMGKKSKDFKLLKVADGDFFTEKFYQILLTKSCFGREVAGHYGYEWYRPTDDVMAIINKTPEWLNRIYWQSNSLGIKYGKNVKFRFDGTNVHYAVKE